MNNIGTGVVPVTTPGSKTNLQLIDINTLDMDIRKIEEEIKKVLEDSKGHNSYQHFIRDIAQSDEKIDKRKLDIHSKVEEISKLKASLILWKKYIGSEIYSILKAEIQKQKTILQNMFPLTNEEMGTISEFIENSVLDATKKELGLNIIHGMETKGNINFHPNNHTADKPNELLNHWPSEQGKVTELMIVINIINLMILKIELISKKTIITTIGTFRMSIGDITQK